MRLKIIGLFLGAIALQACASTGQTVCDQCFDSTELSSIAGGKHRSNKNISRNRFRHPVKTLEFFGLRPETKVIEIAPSGGWYAEIIAPFVKERGSYTGTVGSMRPKKGYQKRANKTLFGKFKRYKKSFPKGKFVVFSPPSMEPIGPDGSADMVLTFRNLHNWMRRYELSEAFRTFYRVLKPGGVLGVVEHRGNPAVSQDPKAASGYVNEEYVIAMAKKAGFRLARRSDINANPRDTKNHPKGVWTLPPSLRLKDKDRDRYLAVGESDRMTLKFIKPE